MDLLVNAINVIKGVQESILFEIIDIKSLIYVILTYCGVFLMTSVRETFNARGGMLGVHSCEFLLERMSISVGTLGFISWYRYIAWGVTIWMLVASVSSHSSFEQRTFAAIESLKSVVSRNRVSPP
jgi:hypothetical protein